MASTYKTPGVYVQEISKFPPSVAQVETAIPAFIGYTEKAQDDKTQDPLLDVPVRIRSLEEFRAKFGGAPKPKTLVVKGGVEGGAFVPNEITIEIGYKMFNSLELFFANGGGPCYIVSVGDYKTAIAYANLNNGLSNLKKFDEPTLFVIPDAISLYSGSDITEYATLMSNALDQCNALQDRFTIMDVINGNEAPDSIISNFRNKVTSSYLKYGAAYYPFLKAFLSLNFNAEDISFTDASDAPILLSGLDTNPDYSTVMDSLNTKAQRDAVDGALAIDTYKAAYKSACDGVVGAGEDYASYKLKLRAIGNVIKAKAEELIDLINPATTVLHSTSSLYQKIMSNVDINSDLISLISDKLVEYDITFPSIGMFTTIAGTTAPPLADPLPDEFSTPTDEYIWALEYNGAWDASTYDVNLDYKLYEIDLSVLLAGDTIYGTASTGQEKYNVAIPYFDSLYIDLLNILKAVSEAVMQSVDANEENLKSTTVYQSVLSKIYNTPVELPPSGAIAGIYARVDHNRGVWKAPANVSISNILGPSVKIDDAEQESLNVDSTGGKSVNAIRSFVGKGTLVWGARTLAGNDNEWRYIPVRRFFNMVEESVKKSTAWAVFEPNDANLWIKVKAMIENYLTTLWRQGALAGSKAEQAFYVNVGLDETMTSLDILEGRMIVEIGMAAVRPAEFIILKFSHKMQEA